jgi:hypothetical protein
MCFVFEYHIANYINKACYLLFSHILKYMCYFEMSLKKFNLNAKHKILKINSWLLFDALNLVFSYLCTYLGR